LRPLPSSNGFHREGDLHVAVRPLVRRSNVALKPRVPDFRGILARIPRKEKRLRARVLHERIELLPIPCRRDVLEIHRSFKELPAQMTAKELARLRPSIGNRRCTSVADRRVPDVKLSLKH